MYFMALGSFVGSVKRWGERGVAKNRMWGVERSSLMLRRKGGILMYPADPSLHTQLTNHLISRAFPQRGRSVQCACSTTVRRTLMVATLLSSGFRYFSP